MSKISKKNPQPNTKVDLSKTMELHLHQEAKKMEESNREFEESAKKQQYVYVSKKETKNKYTFPWKSKSFLWKTLIIIAILVVLIIIVIFVVLYFAKTYK